MAWTDVINKDLKDEYSKKVEYYDTKGYSNLDISAQSIHSKPEYTVIDETEETVFVQDETGAPHVFTREEWQKMQGTGGAGLVVLGALAAGLFLLA